MLEKKIEKEICKYAKSKGILTFKFVSPGKAGVSDQIFILPWGRVLFVEFKQRGEKPKPHQVRNHNRLAKNKATVYVIDSIELGQEVIDYECENFRPHRSAIRVTGCD